MATKNVELPFFKDNGFDVIRIVCALCIMFSHYCVKTFGIDNVHKGFLFAGSSLVVFFVLQGFLVIPSSLRNGVKQYVMKRILRLYPSFVFTLVTTIIVVLLAGYKLGVFETFIYFIKGLILFDGTDFHGISNGAVWAILVQIQIYIISYLLANRISKINSMKIWILILIILIGINYLDKKILLTFDEIGLHYVGGIYAKLFLRYAYFFWIGMMIWKFYNVFVPILKKHAYFLLAFHFIWHWGWVKLPLGYCYTDPITVITGAFAAIGIAYKFGNVKLKYEISYDVFIWHMPVYTGLNLFLPKIGWSYVFLSIIITLFFSSISYYLSNRLIGYINKA